jgi:hypothetical protein
MYTFRPHYPYVRQSECIDTVVCPIYLHSEDNPHGVFIGDIFNDWAVGPGVDDDERKQKTFWVAEQLCIALTRQFANDQRTAEWITKIFRPPLPSLKVIDDILKGK